MEITETHVRNFIEALSHGLPSGLGSPKPGEMCIEAVWCNVLGLPHGDDPKCVTPFLRSLKIKLNDSNWSSNTARAKGMLKLGIAQVGSLDVIDDAELRRRVVTMTMRVMVPIALRAAASKAKESHKQSLENAALKLEAEPTVENCRAARSAAAAADDAAAAAADDAAAYAAAAAAYAAAYAAAAAADAAAAAAAYDAAAAADDAAAAAYAAADAYAKRDEILTRFADEVLNILIDMKAPGCKWLYLLES